MYFDSKSYSKRSLNCFKLALTLVIINLNGLVDCGTSVEQFLEAGTRLLASGQLADALTQFHSAVDADPNNYMSFYRRGTVYLATGKFKPALQDFNRVIELKPDFTSARLQRANILLKQGSFQDSIQDYQYILKYDQRNEEALTRVDKVYALLSDLGTAKQLMDSRDYMNAVELYTRVLETCPWSTDVHELRSECYLSMGDVSKAILDINALAKLIPDNTKAYYTLSDLHYSMGEADLALNDIRECLRLDPDHKKCSDSYKKLRKLTKLLEGMRRASDESNFDECVRSAQQVLAHDPKSASFKLKANSYLCSCNSRAKHSSQAIESCSEVLKSNPQDADAHYHRAQAHIVDEQLDKAQADCQKAHELENSQRTHECIDRVNKLIKQSKKRDYYKILGVKRSADKNQILKAYRKLAHKWHPDKYTGDEKEKAQKTFIDIAAAKEVLTDPEKRAKFDNGEDPLDAEEQANQGFNPFGHGFNPFGHGGGGGGFQFKFKFN